MAQQLGGGGRRGALRAASSARQCLRQLHLVRSKASKFGLNIRDTSKERKFWLLQPESAEEALNSILKMLKFRHPHDKGRSAFDIIVLDSIAALVTQAELGGEIGDNVVAGGCHLSGGGSVLSGVEPDARACHRLSLSLIPCPLSPIP